MDTLDTEPPGLAGEIQGELLSAVQGVWRFGANFIVGWNETEAGIRLVYLPDHSLPRVAKAHPRVLERQRHIATEEALTTLLAAGCQQVDIALNAPLPASEAAAGEVDDLLRRYSATYCPNRAVALYDIVSFSIHSGLEQIALINALSQSIVSAAAYCAELGMPIDASLTTTGDGFYVWNREEGLAADIALYAATILALAMCSGARKDAARDVAPQVKCCFRIGSDVEYFQSSGTGRGPTGFIVGDVTISLARMIAAMVPKQFIIGTFSRELDEGDADLARLIGSDVVDTHTFLALTQMELVKLIDAPLPGGTIETISNFLTGEKISDQEFAVKKYQVVDKHGVHHRCFNARLNIETSEGNMISAGLLDEELSDFQGEHLANEDVRVRLR
ncbi:MAG: hypothetical protein ACTSUD_12610 [Alphaproteobacteria bacterium]